MLARVRLHRRDRRALLCALAVSSRGADAGRLLLVERGRFAWRIHCFGCRAGSNPLAGQSFYVDPASHAARQANAWRAAGRGAGREGDGAAGEAPDRDLDRRRGRGQGAGALAHPARQPGREDRPAGRLPHPRPRLRQLLGRGRGVGARLPQLGARLRKRARLGPRRGDPRTRRDPARHPGLPDPRPRAPSATGCCASRFARCPPAPAPASTWTPATPAGFAPPRDWWGRCAGPASVRPLASPSTSATSTGPAQASATGARSRGRLGGAHFVIDTSRNGNGTPGKRVSGSNWCNPPGRALGHDPTTDTGQRRCGRLPLGQGAGRERRNLPRRPPGRRSGGRSTRCGLVRNGS